MSRAVSEQSPLVLLGAHVLHPLDGFAIQLFLNGDVRHRRGRRRACQCCSPGGNHTTSPGRISATGPPQRCARSKPAVTIRVWPRGWVCHALRAPGSNVTLAPRCARRSRRVEPRIAYGSGKPLGRSFARRFEPLRLISIPAPRVALHARVKGMSTTATVAVSTERRVNRIMPVPVKGITFTVSSWNTLVSDASASMVSLQDAW
jgi:hypothetical protein